MEDRRKWGWSHHVNETASTVCLLIHRPGLLSRCLFFLWSCKQGTHASVSWCSPTHVLIAQFYQKPSFLWRLGLWFQQEPRGKLPLWFSPIEAFSIPQFTVICTRAMFEPGSQIVVNLSLTCGIDRPTETDWIQKMEFESISLKISLWASVFLWKGPEFAFVGGVK